MLHGNDFYFSIQDFLCPKLYQVQEDWQNVLFWIMESLILIKWIPSLQRSI